MRACTRSRIAATHPDTSCCPQESSWTTIDASSTPETSTPPLATVDAKIYRKFGAQEVSVRASSPFLCSAQPVSSARGRLSGHQRTHIAKLMPLSLPFRFLDPTLTLQPHTAQLTLFRSTLSPLNRLTASHRPRHPFRTGLRLSALSGTHVPGGADIWRSRCVRDEPRPEPCASPCVDAAASNPRAPSALLLRASATRPSLGSRGAPRGSGINPRGGKAVPPCT